MEMSGFTRPGGPFRGLPPACRDRLFRTGTPTYTELASSFVPLRTALIAPIWHFSPASTLIPTMLPRPTVTYRDNFTRSRLHHAAFHSMTREVHVFADHHAIAELEHVVIGDRQAVDVHAAAHAGAVPAHVERPQRRGPEEGADQDPHDVRRDHVAHPVEQRPLEITQLPHAVGSRAPAADFRREGRSATSENANTR